jgi:galactose mutarotase-like enzyme
MSRPAPTPLESVVLASGDTTVYLAPDRGGMATRFFVGDRPVFYLDVATLLDRTKNVRGGCPVLFPSPGKLAGDRFTQGGRSGSLAQHGFARNLPWEVVGRTDREATLELRSSGETLKAFPWDFVATYRYRLEGAKLRIEQRFTTESASPMPFGAGFHPYFELADARKANTDRPRIATGATRAFDNTTKRMMDLRGPIDLASGEVDLHLVDHDADVLALDLGDGRRVEVRASPEMNRWVIWTLPGRDFVCVEPWTARGDALNTGESLLYAARGRPVDLWTEIALA